MTAAGTPKNRETANAASKTAPEICIFKIQFRLCPMLSTSGLQRAFKTQGKYAHAATNVITALEKPRSFIATGATRSTIAFGKPCAK